MSTALMYSFAQREDTTVIDEPFYAHYLHKSGVNHPGKEEILASQSCDPLEVIRLIEQVANKSEHVFVKNMAHHLIGMDNHFLNVWMNIFLIRNPANLISSFCKVIPNPTMKDIGIKRQYELYDLLKDKKCPILDSDLLLQNPKSVLEALCETLAIKFDTDMLSWKSGAIPEDGVWAQHWYKNVHASEGFTKRKQNNIPVPSHCNDLLEESLAYYNQLKSRAIKP